MIARVGRQKPNKVELGMLRGIYLQPTQSGRDNIIEETLRRQLCSNFHTY